MSFIEELEKNLTEEQKKKKRIYLQLFKSENGEFVLNDLKKLTALDSPVGPMNLENSNYINGSRDVLIYILNMIKEER